MDTLAPLIADLALILICAGIMTLIFKKLKQPLVLGYIVAGFIASPHFTLTPSVMDAASIHVWSDIGVIFLLFALGLEFSFKKIVKVGGPAIIAALTIIFGMIFLGFTVGSAFGWSKMDALFLGGMISMSPGPCQEEIRRPGHVHPHSGRHPGRGAHGGAFHRGRIVQL